jgi:hypothetical protein
VPQFRHYLEIFYQKNERFIDIFFFESKKRKFKLVNVMIIKVEMNQINLNEIFMYGLQFLIVLTLSGNIILEKGMIELYFFFDGTKRNVNVLIIELQLN